VSDLVTLSEIEEAAHRLRGKILRTPLVPFAGLLVKAESLQSIGAFKIRGAFAAITALGEKERVSGVIAHSSGNHAQAVAYAARSLGLSAVLVLPRTAPSLKVERCRALGAEIVFVEPTMEARVRTTEKLAEAHDLAVIPPFDDRRVIAGQGTIALEILAEVPMVDTILVPVGGGGLVSGIATAIKLLHPRTSVIGVEPENAADARESLRAGRPVTWPAERVGETIADALRVTPVGELTFAHMKEYVDGIVTVTDDEIREAMRRLAFEARLVAEPGGAVAVAAHLFRDVELPGGDSRVAILSGGNIAPQALLDVLAEPEEAGQGDTTETRR
jgi:threonine dehydratase